MLGGILTYDVLVKLVNDFPGSQLRHGQVSDKGKR
jgi:hypothetical protein